MFRVLSLDGGGIRGAFIAACLARFERDLRRPLTDYFDLIVGTSTGGIIALALALGESADSILDFYRHRGAQIFTRRQSAQAGFFENICLKAVQRKFPALDTTALRRSKYAQEHLRAALTDFFGDRTIGDIRSSRVVIPAVNLLLGRTVTFKTPHQPNFVRDSAFRVVDVALCTSAAPIYFPQASIAEGTSYADGGLWANNPAVVAYAEAVKISRVCTRQGIDPVFGPEDVLMLSVGTGKPQYYAKPRSGDDGMVWWGPRLFEVAAGAQSQGVHFQAQYLMGPDRYTRIDFDMPTDPWTLDDVQAIDDLIVFGEQSAIDHFPSLRPTFMAVEKAPYQPYL
jgi:hypothetical protein